MEKDYLDGMTANCISRICGYDGSYAHAMRDALHELEDDATAEERRDAIRRAISDEDKKVTQTSSGEGGDGRPMAEDESRMERNERLGLAYCRMNCGEWDDYAGEKPVGYDELPSRSGWVLGKDFYLVSKMIEIEGEIGREGTSRAWWRYALKATEGEWRRYWESKSHEDESLLRYYRDELLKQMQDIKDSQTQRGKRKNDCHNGQGYIHTMLFISILFETAALIVLLAKFF